MFGKNPYENDEDVNIPQFVADEEEDEFDEEYFNEEKPAYYKVKKPVVVVVSILLVLFLGLGLFGLIFGVGKKNDYDTLKKEYDEYVTTAKDKTTKLNEKIDSLQAELDALNAQIEQAKVVEAGTTYRVVVDSLNIRSGAGPAYQIVGSKISGDTFKIVETTDVTVDGIVSTWGKIEDSAWICIISGGVEYCQKQ